MGFDVVTTITSPLDPVKLLAYYPVKYTIIPPSRGGGGEGSSSTLRSIQVIMHVILFVQATL